MKRVLIVDDDSELRLHLLEILNENGYEVDSAPSAKDALAKCGTQRFDVVLLDFMMPKTSGLDVLQEMQKRHPKTKVIMITAFASVENAVDAVKKGASDYISKPFKISDLLTTIRRVLEEARFESGVKSLDLDKTCNAIASPIRRDIIKLLNDTGAMRLMEMARELGVEDHTKVVFHLKMLKEAGIIEQDPSKNYALSEAGNKAVDCLRKMEQLLLN